jgi:hypothetical protein
MSMNRKSSVLVVIAIIAATLAPTVRGHNAATATIPDQISTDRAGDAPIVLAQGRCFNGRCF